MTKKEELKEIIDGMTIEEITLAFLLLAKSPETERLVLRSYCQRPALLEVVSSGISSQPIR